MGEGSVRLRKMYMYKIVIVGLLVFFSNAIRYFWVGAFIGGTVCFYFLFKKHNLKNEKLRRKIDKLQHRPTKFQYQVPNSKRNRPNKFGLFGPGLNCLLNNIKKDFIESWYKKLSRNEEFGQATNIVLNNFALKLNSSLKSTYLCYELLRRILAIFSLHITMYNRAKSLMTIKNDTDLFTVYSSLTTKLHPAAATAKQSLVTKESINKDFKKLYIHMLTENVFNLYFNEEELSCQTLRIPLKEIIAFKVVTPFFSYLTNNFAQQIAVDPVGESRHILNAQIVWSSEADLFNNASYQPPELKQSFDHRNGTNEDFLDFATKSQSESTLFQSVKIPLTEKAHEVRSNKEYTLYVIEYKVCTNDIHTKYTVRRRFREFVNLQSRLAKQTNIKKFLKDIDVKEPNRFRTLPFGNMDKEFIKSRRSLLETYLKSLCSIDDICLSSELREFLAYKGDAHIEYVRKAPDLLPRLDKILVRNFAEILGSVNNPLIIEKEDINNVEELLIEMNDKNSTRNYTFYPPLELVSTLKTNKYLEKKNNSAQISNNMLERPIYLQPKEDSYKYPTCTESTQMIICGIVLESEYPFICIKQLQHFFSVLSKDTIESLLKKRLSFINIEPDQIFVWICESLWPDNILYKNHPDHSKREIKRTPQEILLKILDRYAFFVKEENSLGIFKGIFNTLDSEKINRNILFIALDTLLDLLGKTTEF